MFFRKKEEPKAQFTYGRSGDLFVISCDAVDGMTTLRLSPEEAARLLATHAALFPAGPAPTAPSEPDGSQADQTDSTQP